MVKGFAIRPHEIVMNYVSGAKSYWVDDQDLAPESYAEQFVDPDPTKALPVSELLRRARMRHRRKEDSQENTHIIIFCL
jgi:transcription elongation factor SPT6